MRRIAYLLACLLALPALGAHAQSRGALTPVLISSEDECRVSVDGEDQGILASGGIKKIGLAPGEHLFSAVCAGERRWKETVTVGQQQKVVAIPAAAEPRVATPPPTPAATPPPAGRTGCLLDKDPVGRWIVRAVALGSGCDKARVRPGAIVVSANGKKMQDATADDLATLDAGAVGSNLEGEILESDGTFRKVVITRGVLPEAGTMSALQADGKSVRGASFDRAHPFDAAGTSATSDAPAKRLATPVPTEFKSVTRSCTGIALGCAQRAEYQCGLGVGCMAGAGSCTGVPVGGGCPGKPQATCAATPGCQWMFNACIGAGATCASNFNQWSCNGKLGCSWKASCTGFALPCQTLNESSCSLQPGCFLQ